MYILRKTAFLFVVLYLINGCATTQQKIIENNYSDSVFDANILVIIPQDHLIGTVHATRSSQTTINTQIQYGGAFGGLVGGVLDAIHTSASIKKMHNLVAPLNNRVGDLDFKSDFIHKLKDKFIFTTPERIKLVEETPEYEADLIALVKKTEQPTIVIKISYSLDPNYRTLMMDSVVSLWLEKSGTPSYITTVSYYSPPITQFLSYYSTSLSDALLLRAIDNQETHVYAKNIELWAENRASVFRKYYAEGIEESLNIINEALLNKYDSQNLEKKKVSNFVDYHGKPYISFGRAFDHVTVGRVIKEQNNRLWLLSSDGSFSSYYNGPVKRTAKNKSTRRYR